MKTEKEIADEFVENIRPAVKIFVEQTVSRLIRKLEMNRVYSSGGVIPAKPAPPPPITVDTTRGTCVKHIDGRVGEFMFIDGNVAGRVWVAWNGDQIVSVCDLSLLRILPPCESDDCLDPVEQIGHVKSQPDALYSGAQLETYRNALERIMDFHPPGNATHECAKKALLTDG